MKAKTYIQILIFFLAIGNGNLVYAQDFTDYYSNKEFASGENVMYKITPVTQYGSIYEYEISNVNNRWHGEPATYKQGLIANPNEPYYAISINNEIPYKAIKEVLSREQIELFAKEKQSLRFIEVINDQGNVTEIIFSMRPNERILSIHPDQLYAIEEYLKKHDKKTLNEEAKKLNFILNLNTISFNRLLMEFY